MSRARHASSVYVVADDLDQARENLARDWAARRTPTWAIDTALPGPQQLKRDPEAVGERERAGIVALRHAQARLLATATRPGRAPAPPEQADTARAALSQARQHLAELADPAGLAGTPGTYGTGPVGDAARQVVLADGRLGQLEHAARAGGWRERRQARRDLPAATAVAAAAEDRLAPSSPANELTCTRTSAVSRPSSRVSTSRRLSSGSAGNRPPANTPPPTQAQQRLDRALQTARRRLEQPDRPDQPARRRRTPGPWQPAPRPVIEPPEAIHDGPDL